MTLRRTRDKIDYFTGPYQSGFKRGRSCAYIVCAQRILISVVMTQTGKLDFHKMGIDMSRAFNTIKRKRILDALLQASCKDDELRLLRALLAGTKLNRIIQGHSPHQTFLPATSLLHSYPPEKAPTRPTHQSLA